MQRNQVVVGALAVAAVTALLVLWPRSDRGGGATPAAPRAGERPGAAAGELSSASLAAERATEPAAADVVPADAPAREPAVDDGLALLRGTLLDADTLVPLPGYRLELSVVFDRDAEPRDVTTDAAGTFTVPLVPGEHLVLHRAEPGGGDRALARVVTPHRFEVARRDDGAPAEQTFLARPPPAGLEVEVLHADGRPAADAWVLFACRMEDPPFVDTGARTDAAGRARIGVWDPERFTFGRLAARDDDGNASDVVTVDAPLAPGLRRLVLGPGGVLEVQVTEADGRPVADRRAVLSGHPGLAATAYRATDGDGRLRFDGLLPGAYTLGVWIPAEGRWDRRGVDVLRGERRWLDVVLPEPEEPLAVAGTVVDEEGRPLPDVDLAVALDGRHAGRVRTDADGAFRLRAPPAERVWVGANAVQQEDLYEPAEADVAFGAEHLLFRRVERAATRAFEVEVVDARTGVELEHFVAQIDRGPGTERWSDSYAPRRRFELRLLPDARWRVKSRGYVTRELQLHTELDALAEGERLRVGLEPGLDHAFEVLDGDTLQPIPGVLFRSPTAGEVRSDARGRVHLRADHWSAYAATKEGYDAREWDPDDDLLWGRGPFFLYRP